MSKWSWYQVAILLTFTLLIFFNNFYSTSMTKLFSFIDQWVPSHVLIVFFTVIVVVWSTALFLYFQNKKGGQLFVHKIWRIMPALMGVLFFLSFLLAIVLFLTSLSSMDPTMFWVLDLSIIYFIVILYVFILSLFIRYGKKSEVATKISTSAHTTVLLLFIVLWMLPGIF